MILRAKYLITGDGRTCLQDQAVYLDKEGKIGWIGDAAEAAGRYPEEMVKDYGEATILPGLFDMHVHFGYYYSQPDLDNYDDYMVAYYALESEKAESGTGETVAAARHHDGARSVLSAQSDEAAASGRAEGVCDGSANHPCGRRYLHDRWTRTSGWGRGGGQPVGRARCYPKTAACGS